MKRKKLTLRVKKQLRERYGADWKKRLKSIDLAKEISQNEDYSDC